MADAVEKGLRCLFRFILPEEEMLEDFGAHWATGSGFGAGFRGTGRALAAQQSYLEQATARFADHSLYTQKRILAVRRY